MLQRPATSTTSQNWRARASLLGCPPASSLAAPTFRSFFRHTRGCNLPCLPQHRLRRTLTRVGGGHVRVVVKVGHWFLRRRHSEVVVPQRVGRAPDGNFRTYSAPTLSPWAMGIHLCPLDAVRGVRNWGRPPSRCPAASRPQRNSASAGCFLRMRPRCARRVALAPPTPNLIVDNR